MKVKYQPDLEFSNYFSRYESDKGILESMNAKDLKVGELK